MPILYLPPRLAKSLQINEIKTGADDFLTCLKDVCRQYPILCSYCFKTDDLTELSAATCFYINCDDIRILMKTNSTIPLSVDDVIEIEPAMVGG